MAIEFDCPSCRTRIRVDESAAGKQARCPQCQQISPVPRNSLLPPPGGLGAPLSPLPSNQPSADPFTPQSAPQYAPKPPGQAYAPPQKPVSANPFGDQLAPSGAPLNPYQSPSAYASAEQLPITPEELKQKLFGPAVGIVLGALINIGIIAVFSVMIWLDKNFHEDIKGVNDAETIGAYIAFGFFIVVALLPSLAALLAPWAMFRGRGLVAAWLGSIAAVLPCNPCFFVTAGFAIWGMVLLSDPRINKGMQ